MSRAIEDLMHEHEAILAGLAILDAMVARLGGADPPTARDAREFLGFLKEFADTCHHGKEEGILFPALVKAGIPEKGGPIAQMLAEHAEGRMLIRGMEAAIAGAVDARAFTAAAEGYAALLRGHIGKENVVLFPLAEKALTPARLDVIFDGFEQHEEKVIGHGRHEELHEMLKDLKRKYPAAAR
jgi:hemerythrin-like domain-containing protein